MPGALLHLAVTFSAELIGGLDQFKTNLGPALLAEWESV